MFIRQKVIFSVVLHLALSIAISGCISSDESTRDLSTPSRRLVGHWGIYGDGTLVPKDKFVSEMWFGELNDDGVGSFSIFTDGSAAGMRDINSSQNYEVLLESGDAVTIGSFVGETPPDPIPQELMVRFEITKDGQMLRQEGKLINIEFQYIDSKTEP